MSKTASIACVLGLLVGFAVRAEAATRIKDVATLSGAHEVRLTGYGLVIGLNGTGDSARSLFTNQAVANALTRLGLRIDAKDVRTKNVAAVIVTANLPPYSRTGNKLDVLVSSVGDAKSLKGGTLVYTPLVAANAKVMVVSSGPLAVGGWQAQGSGSSVTKNHPTVGRIPGGGTTTVDFAPKLDGREKLVYVLHDADFTTALNAAEAITKAGAPAKALDARTIVVDVAEAQRSNPVPLIAKIESVTLETDVVARVVLNARTGTVVMGQNVRIAEVALAHGGLQVAVEQSNDVSQPNALAMGGTRPVSNAKVDATETRGQVRHVKQTATLADLVTALNTLGVSPHDLVDILQALRTAGALNAEIVIQ